ncbi:MAG TPA: type II toxin-antitoxin system VapC family toxin [Candidatus Desulfofervidus auxilii]|uniref:Type II toxin-antitoxin system VapC family toxin n=1 Tax=Desulfofervidus auxilii TaxID=1621989 RepID=A0A7C1ZP98_DESA2|nr:type II toxin-antitoxin system VapC family toxin [Candidatus Desulfofervidus auxilii]
MILVDSYGWIEYFAEGPLCNKYEQYLTNLKDIITPVIVVYEVYKKIKRERDEKAALEVLAQLSKTNIITLSETLAVKAADVSLKFKLPMADAIVYATAIIQNCEVVTSDPHFKELPNVIFIE